ncbi:M48 family metallopeptidase [Pontibacter sp. E15-1]|uniref:M48 family metallopeptidase n=1 Tax=Pontibacter sp. E15-1 TaxID=2919918 RepID=UPI001F5035FA|nr:M48 family metallopeptidase [Pontibacter sp. E15-1]MCJ8163872.1 M48 family metallopeptidase [Pontibacter sp. E15-1]
MLALFVCEQTGKMIICVFTLMMSAIFPLYAQEEEYYPFYSSDSTKLRELAVAQQASLKNHFVVPRNMSPDYRESYNTIIKKSAEESYRRVLSSALLDTIVDPYIQSVYRVIVRANSDLPDTKLILTRSAVENAYALADGTVFFNIGLLAKLENESQIAFIICHELAHIKLSHMERSIKESLDAFYSKEFKKQYRQTAKVEYNRHAKMGALLQGLSLGNLQHRRSFEKQADSLGFVFLSRTKYSTAEAYTALQALDKIDAPYSSQKLDLGALFSCSDFSYSFEEGQAKESSIFDVRETMVAFPDNPDTLRTHPDCLKRMGYIRELERAFPVEANRQTYQTSALESIKLLCRREVVQSLYETQNYDYALFNALLLLREQPESGYLKSMVMLCLYELKRHLLLHRFAEVVSVESEHHPENFQHLLRVLYNLNTSDFEGIGNCFAQKMRIEEGTHEYQLAAQYAFAVLREDTEVAEQIKKTYLDRHKEGRFRETLFSASLK